jgi:hypothetical protein
VSPQSIAFRSEESTALSFLSAARFAGLFGLALLHGLKAVPTGLALPSAADRNPSPDSFMHILEIAHLRGNHTDSVIVFMKERFERKA